jgi:hypothetical protein
VSFLFIAPHSDVPPLIEVLIDTSNKCSEQEMTVTSVLSSVLFEYATKGFSLS